MIFLLSTLLTSTTLGSIDSTIKVNLAFLRSAALLIHPQMNLVPFQHAPFPLQDRRLPDTSATASYTGSELPRRLKPQPPLRSIDKTLATTTAIKSRPEVGNFRLPPPTSIATRPERERGAKSHTPALYEAEDDTDTKLAHLPGAAAYYKSRAFRRKKAVGQDQVPRHKIHSTEDAAVSDSDEDMDAANTTPEKPKSLIMIFSRSNARRARTNNKLYLRMQRQNKRA